MREGKNEEADRIKLMNMKKPDENVEEVKKVEKEPPATQPLESSKHSMGGAWGRTGLKKGPN